MVPAKKRKDEDRQASRAGELRNRLLRAEGADVLDPSQPTPPSTVFRRRVREVRQKHGWSQQDLADRLTALGVPMDRATVARTETETRGARGISLDDAMAFAVALDVDPQRLFLPLESVVRTVRGTTEPMEDPIQIALTPETPATVSMVRAWFRSGQPLWTQDGGFYRRELPDEDWIAGQHPGFGHLEKLLSALREVIVAEKPAEERAQILRWMREELDRQDQFVELKAKAEQAEKPSRRKS